jgi:hypothetical protein
MTLFSRVSSAQYFRIRIEDRLTGLALVVAHLEQVAVQNLISDVQFTGDKKRVEMSLGPSYPSLSLEVCEFRTAIPNLSHVPDLASNANDNLNTFTSIVTLQYGVPDDSIGHLMQTCLYYVENVSNCENLNMGSSRITRNTFDAIRHFQRASRTANQVSISLPCKHWTRAKR